ncbi:hypothetical protein EU520_00330 [Candidatus Thorarchaeota archaeon]|nr:MAG: hypothetical protein EU520_00330 [Candidatus Thorarchaeota archaeon]
MSLFRRLVERLKGSKKKEPKPEDLRTDEETEAEETESTTPSPPEPTTERTPPPTETLVATAEELGIDPRATISMAKAAKIRPQKVSEIVPGKELKRDDQGRIHIKIVFYGPSLSGKTTALRWLFANVRSLSKGKIIEIADELGRTTFFDFVPITASEKVVFDVFTVAGQRRHAQNRITVLRDADGIIFMADSRPETMNENLASMEELRIALGTDRLATMPIVISLNKRDLPNALPVNYMADMLDVEGYPIYPTIATEGKNLLRMFQRVLRDALIFKVGI